MNRWAIIGSPYGTKTKKGTRDQAEGVQTLHVNQSPAAVKESQGNEQTANDDVRRHGPPCAGDAPTEALNRPIGSEEREFVPREQTGQGNPDTQQSDEGNGQRPACVSCAAQSSDENREHG